jgi:AMP-polyphosphate phosphotransferase
VFETAELGRSIEKSEYSARVPGLRTELLQLQRKLEPADFPVIVLLNGVDGAGRSETLNLLHEWLDTRYLVTEAFGPPTDEERQRPEFWRYALSLPPRGKIGIFVGNWYTMPILGRTYGDVRRKAFEQSLARIRAFEKMHADDGALFVKFWLHIGKREQRKRLKKLASERATRWRVTPQDWKNHALYDRFVDVSAQALQATSSGEAPWNVVESADERYRNLTVAETLRDRIRVQLEARKSVEAPRPPDPNVPDPSTVLDALDLSQKLDKEEYEKKLEALQGRLNRLARRLAKQQKSAILVFEGWDAAGKGGAIRRLVHALDARQYRVIPVAAPSDEEKSHHYLWRFWRQLPRLGRFTIYDRSWYGRVLVERVEGLASEPEWRRAYAEINDFEDQLVDHGTILCKFWLHVSREEQLRRFEERRREPWKYYKLTPEDFRNRDKWNLYEGVADEMVERTSTQRAPWTLVEAEDKRFARIKVLETVTAALKAAL